MRNASEASRNRFRSAPGRWLLIVGIITFSMIIPPHLQARNCDKDVNVTVRSDGYWDAVTPVGTGSYVATIECDGDFFMFFGEPTFHFDFRASGYSGLATVPEGDAGGNVSFKIEGGFEMTAPFTARTYKAQFNFVIGDTRYYLRYAAVSVRRLDEFRWEIEALDAVADYAELLRTRARGKSAIEAAWPGTASAPFHMTVMVPGH